MYKCATTTRVPLNSYWYEDEKYRIDAIYFGNT